MEKYHARISFSQKGKIILEFDNSPPGELNDPLTSFICSISDDTRAESGNTDHLSVLNQPLPFLWAKFPTDIGKIHSTPSIMIRIDSSEPLPRINQYPMSNEASQGIKPIIEDYMFQGLIIPCIVLVPVTLPF